MLLGGSFDPWGGPGYDACEVLTGPDFQDVFYKQNWASNAKLMSFYMLYGLVYYIQLFRIPFIVESQRDLMGGASFPRRVHKVGTLTTIST